MNSLSYFPQQDGAQESQQGLKQSQEEPQELAMARGGLQGLVSFNSLHRLVAGLICAFSAFSLLNAVITWSRRAALITGVARSSNCWMIIIGQAVQLALERLVVAHHSALLPPRL